MGIEGQFTIEFVENVPQPRSSARPLGGRVGFRVIVYGEERSRGFAGVEFEVD